MKSVSETVSQNTKYQITTLLLIVGSNLFLAACSPSSSNNPAPAGMDAQSLASSGAIAVGDATSEQCPTGGKVYSVYLDANHNGTKEANETAYSIQTVCNGLNGISGKNSLFATQRVETNMCASGLGLQIQLGLDTNSNLSLEGEEISKTEILCDGKDGAPGSAGPAGSNGHSIVFQSFEADSETCPNGGVTTLMALDILDSGIYSFDYPNQHSMTVCNGRNGKDGKDGEDGQDGQNAEISPYTPVDVISPCGSTAAYREVLLRFKNGKVLASLSDNASGDNTRFSLLPDGNFITTDGAKCNFSLSTSNDKTTRSVSWSNQIQKSWPLLP